MKFYLSILIIFIYSSIVSAQTIHGMVGNKAIHEPLIGATVMELGTQNGAITNELGLFKIEVSSSNALLVASYSGFISDTVKVTFDEMMHIGLEENTSELTEVVIQASSTFIDDREALHTEVITEAELTKAACCNLSESFETNASVDVSFSDAVTGAKTIRMLGLDGRYVLINRENIPNVRGLAGRYGLSYVPGTWIQSIDLGKGAGTVVNGFESMTGQINVELKKPENSEKLYLNGYANSFGRLELNANHALKMSEKWHMGLLVHSNYFNNEIDQNKDGFMDLPKGRQINLMNRYRYKSEKMISQLGITYMQDERAGGQLGFDFNDDLLNSSFYGFKNNTTRAEVFGKTGLLFPHKPYKGWGFIYSASLLDINGGFGRDLYTGREHTLYGNVIYQNIIMNTFHQYKTGISLMIDEFDESYADSVFSRKESVPGIYYEYTYKPGDQFSLMLGGRIDFHNLYGNLYTPRVHLRYQLSEATTLRGAIGKGYRTPNVLMENSAALVSARRLRIVEVPRQEESWNAGGSFITAVPINDRKLNLIFDYFSTHFINQLIYDMDKSSEELVVYNLRGKSKAHSFQTEVTYQLTDYLSFKSAYKYYDVKSTINGVFQDVPYNSKHRFFLNGSYATKFDKWKIDGTLNWYGAKRLPDTSDKPQELQRQKTSPDFVLLNTQISRSFRNGSIYLGAENLLDFVQKDPIIDAENPFEDEFDASIVWAPIAGRLIYAGVRFKMKN